MESDWNIFPIGDVCDAIFDGPHATPKKTNDGPIFLGISNLQNGQINLSDAEHLSEEDFTYWTRRVTPRKDDIVFSYETRLGEAAIVPDGLRFCLGRRMALMRPAPNKIVPRFLLYAYLGPEFQQTLRARTVHGSTVDRIPLIEFPSFPISLPPLPEQRAIAGILGALDDKIELNRRMNRTLESMVRAVFRQWFVENEGSNEWEVKTLGNVFSVLETGSRPKGGASQEPVGVPSVGAESIVKLGDFDFSKTKYVPLEFFESMRRGHIEDRDVLLYKDGGRPGEFEPHVSMFGDGFPFEKFSINEHVYRIRVRAPLTQSYFYFWLESDEIMDEMRNRGTGVAVPGLNSTAFSGINISIPPIKLLDEFSGFVDRLISKILANAKESRTLASLRDTLLPRLMRGEVKVSEL